MRAANAPTVVRPGLSTTEVMAGFLLAHIPLALLMHRYTGLATIHALATLLVGLWFALSGGSPLRVVFVAAYITGAEVLWRMTNAGVFWEFGKYATITIFVIATLRSGRLSIRPWPFLYFGLLLPSVFTTLENVDLAEARRQISFNLSGPLALMISAWFFSHLQLSREQLHGVFLILISPVAGIASVAVFTTAAAESINFTDASNFTTSGGFGPVQVSCILGLAVLLAFFYVLYDHQRSMVRSLLLVLIPLLAAQSALTFSRSGLYCCCGAVALASVYLIRDVRTRARLAYVVPIIAFACFYVLLPRLDAFTSGALSERFQSTRLTGRDRIAEADLRIWKDNPVFGVGPGLAKPLRQGMSIAAHTEFTRLLAEHGALGLAALLVLLIMSLKNLARARNMADKALVMSLMGWSFLFMTTDAMRLVATAFVFGVACANFKPERRGRKVLLSSLFGSTARGPKAGLAQNAFSVDQVKGL